LFKNIKNGTRVNLIVTTSPFGSSVNTPRELLHKMGKDFGINISYNEKGRKYTREELTKVLIEKDPRFIVAGTEKYDKEQLDLCKNLKMISRVGIGLDSIDLPECHNRNVIVSYTPDAPTNAVAELTISQIFSLLRSTVLADEEMRSGNWKRFIGRELKNCCVGVVGNGRIGASVISKLKSLTPKKVLYTDIDVSRKVFPEYVWATKKQILKECDIITLHIPLNEDNRNYLDEKELSLLKKDAIIINTSRGGVINEKSLYRWLHDNSNASAAIDVFEREPYKGNLLTLSNILLSPHLGSCSQMSRFQMEVGAVKSVDAYLSSNKIINRVM